MSLAEISDLVSDWGGFEKLVSQLNETGSVIVEHNVTLEGRSGAPRQIDVLVRHREGLHEHLIVVECKYRNAPVERLHVDALATTVREVGASRGVIFSVEGFQRGAITQAASERNIALFKVRQMTDREWGLPGRHFDLWLHILGVGIGAPQFPNAKVYSPTPPEAISIALELGFPEHVSSTPARLGSGEETTLERLVERLARETARSVYRPLRIDFDGEQDGQVKGVTHVTVAFSSPIHIRLPTAIVEASRLEFDVGLHVDQSRIQIDRASGYAFALAVENCVNKTVMTAARAKGADRTQLKPSVPSTDQNKDAFQNGSLAQVWVGHLLPFSDFDDAPRNLGQGQTMKLDPAVLR